jgi:hypothetical protein
MQISPMDSEPKFAAWALNVIIRGRKTSISGNPDVETRRNFEGIGQLKGCLTRCSESRRKNGSMPQMQRSITAFIWALILSVYRGVAITKRSDSLRYG